MKKLNKLQINPEKIMKNEELVTLRGGYDGDGDGWCGTCTVYEDAPHTLIMSGVACSYSNGGANITCTTIYKAIYGPAAHCHCQ
jgi:hypothetical protein